MTGVPWGFVLAPVLLSTFTRDKDSGIEGTLSTSGDDIKLCGAGNHAEGWQCHPEGP